MPSAAVDGFDGVAMLSRLLGGAKLMRWAPGGLQVYDENSKSVRIEIGRLHSDKIWVADRRLFDAVTDWRRTLGQVCIS